MIPAVVYGTGLESFSITLNKADFMKAYKKSFKEVTFYNLQIEGEKYFSILKDRQTHPVTRDFLHLDFMVIPPTSSFDFEVPVLFEGEAIGMKSGGIMDYTQRSVVVHCTADAVPEAIHLDISHLEVGTSIHVRDLPAGNWQYKDNADNTLVVVHAKKGEAPKAEDSEVKAEA